MTGKWGWIGFASVALVGVSPCVQAQTKTQIPSVAACSGRFPPVTCIERGLNREPGPSIVAPPEAKPKPVADPVKPAAREPDLSLERGYGATSEDAEPLPLSKDELFGTDKPGDVSVKKASTVSFRGFVQNETAYTYADPTHWSRAVTYAQVGASGQFNENLKWKATVRGNVDPVYIWSDFYNDAVKKDERAGFLFEETYVDASTGNWDFRFGRQHIIWGEVVGVFVADVVSAQNQLEFILPQFDIIRIPQWAARGEYFFGDSHLELIWIPYPTYNDIGKPGADFFPVQPPAPAGFTQSFLGEVIPDRNLSNTNYGVRLSTLKGGWDASAFYYSSMDAAPTFYRTVQSTPTPTLQYQPVHNRIWQAGGTIGKAFGSVVFHAEAVYTSGRQYEVTTLTQPNGVVPQNTFEYIFSVDFTLPRELFLNVQLFQNIFFNHDPNLLTDAYNTYASVLLRGKLGPKLEPEILWIQGFSESQNLIRPRLTWHPETNWRAAIGVDIFNGASTTYFGRFNDRDRVYVEVRYDF
jgi:hypothetical protein